MDQGLLRNVGVFAHIDAGKTTLTERILVATGRERRAGRVDDGTTVMDWMPEERERGITITAAATRVRWGGADLNLIDTPGHVDFTFEVERSLRALDGAVLVLDAVAGVQPQTETVWRQLARAGVPTVVFVNKCDRPGADPLAAAGTLKARFGVEPAPIGYPWFDAEGHLVGVIDVLARRAFLYTPDGVPEERDVPPERVDDVLVLHAELVEALASRDEALLEVVGAGREPSADELRRALRRRTLTRELVPVLVGAALRGVGVQPVLDAIVAFLPAPHEFPRESAYRADGTRAPLPPPTADAPFVGFAFKVETRRHDERVFVRIVSGRVAAGEHVWNPRLGAAERVGGVHRVHANTIEALPAAEAGDIVALTGLARTATGDTLVGFAEHAPAFDGALAPLRALEPVLSLVVEPADAEERERLGGALARLAREDPSFHAALDPSSGQWTVQGMGELHLEVTLARLAREFGLAPRVGRPRVAFREVLTGSAAGRGLVERVLGGQDAFADVEVRVEPLPPDALSTAGAARPQVEYEAGAAVPPARRGAVTSALLAEAHSGPRFGLPLAGLRVVVHGGRARAEADAEVGWLQAAVAALREALRHAADAGAVHVHEPYASVVVESPEAFSSGIIGDLQSRGAALGEVESTRGSRRIHARAPFAALFGYTTALRSLSQGRAVATLVPAGHGPVAEGALAARGLVW